MIVLVTISSNSALVVSTRDMYALAAFCILEGSPDLRDTHEQLKVAVVVINRTNASNWVREFGEGITAQLFARGQFEVQPRYGLDHGDFDSKAEAVQAVADAKPGLSVEWATELMDAFIRDAQNATRWQAAAMEVGDATGFRGNGTTNTFRQESPYDDADISSKLPSALLLESKSASRGGSSRVF